MRDPQEAFGRRVRCVNYSDCWYFRPMTVAQLDAVDPEVACTHYNASFHNPAEFQLVLTGNFQVCLLLRPGLSQWSECRL